jgi:hypothetical protein
MLRTAIQLRKYWKNAEAGSRYREGYPNSVSDRDNDSSHFQMPQSGARDRL